MQELQETGLIPGLGRSSRGGDSNPLQYSCLGNPMDRGVWCATAHEVARISHVWVTKQNQQQGAHRCHLLFSSLWFQWVEIHLSKISTYFCPSSALWGHTADGFYLPEGDYPTPMLCSLQGDSVASEWKEILEYDWELLCCCPLPETCVGPETVILLGWAFSLEDIPHRDCPTKLL